MQKGCGTKCIPVPQPFCIPNHFLRQYPTDADRPRIDAADVNRQFTEFRHARLINDILHRAMLPAYLILQHQSLCPEVERMIREMRRHENADALCMKTQHKIEKAVCISSFSMRRRLIENEVPNLSVLP